MSLSPDQLIFLERAARGGRRLLAACGAIAPAAACRVMTKPYDNDDLRRILSDMQGPPR